MNDPEGRCPLWCTSTRSLTFLLLSTLAFIPYGLYWTYDIPGAIQTQLTTYFGGSQYYTPSDNLLLYSIYSYPNLFIPFFVGYFLDKLSVRAGTILTTGFILVGQVIFNIGIEFKIFWVCVVGRLVYGFGGEGLMVAQGKFGSRWFEGDQMSFMFGLLLGFARFGTVLNFVALPWLASSLSVSKAIWVGTAVCVLSFFSSLLAAYIDKKGEQKGIVGVNVAMVGKNMNLKQILFSFKEVLSIPKIAWMIVIVLALFYSVFIPFLATASYVLQTSGRRYSEQESSLYVAMLNVLAIFLPPLCGKLVDRYGYSLWWSGLGTLLLVLGLALFLCLSVDIVFVHPSLIMCLIGLSYSLFIPSFWPAITFVVEENVVGRVYGVSTVLENLGYVLVPTLIGELQTQGSRILNKYIIPLDVLLCISVLPFMLNVAIIIEDARSNYGILNSSGKVKKAQKEKLKPYITVVVDTDITLADDTQ